MAEDNYLLREGVRTLIEGQPELELVAVCGDLPSVLPAIESERLDVVPHGERGGTLGGAPHAP